MPDPWEYRYMASLARYEDVCMAVLTAVAEHERLTDLVDYVASSMQACDLVDAESIALYERARVAAIEADRDGGIR